MNVLRLMLGEASLSPPLQQLADTLSFVLWLNKHLSSICFFGNPVKEMLPAPVSSSLTCVPLTHGLVSLRWLGQGCNVAGGPMAPWSPSCSSCFNIKYSVCSVS